MNPRKFEISRRRFLEGLGLGVGGLILNPIAGLLYREAFGQGLPTRHKIIVAGNGESWGRAFYPPEFAVTGRLGSSYSGGIFTNNYTWPSVLKNIQAFRNNAILLDGMRISTDKIGGNHGKGFGPLAGNDESNPTGITIDQLWARGAAGQGTPHRSVLFGMSRSAASGTQIRQANTFAAGASAPLSHTTHAATLFNDLFGAGGGGSSSNSGVAKRRRVLDAIRADINRLSVQLASAERIKLEEHYLNAIEIFDKKYNTEQPITCDQPSFADPGRTPGKALTEMGKLAAFALKCDMTNVAGISIANAFGTSDGHGCLPKFEFYGSAPSNSNPYSHESSWYISTYHPRLMEFMCGLFRDMLVTMSGQPGVMPPNTTIIYLPLNGMCQEEHHHGMLNRYTALILSSEPTLIKGGYFKRWSSSQDMNLSALFVTISHAIGMPISGFGGYSGGPIRELLA